jgi:hypothetical protein
VGLLGRLGKTAGFHRADEQGEGDEIGQHAADSEARLGRRAAMMGADLTGVNAASGRA